MEEKGYWFDVGVIEWGEGCAATGGYHACGSGKIPSCCGSGVNLTWIEGTVFETEMKRQECLQLYF